MASSTILLAGKKCWARGGRTGGDNFLNREPPPLKTYRFFWSGLGSYLWVWTPKTSLTTLGGGKGGSPAPFEFEGVATQFAGLRTGSNRRNNQYSGSER